jgi:chromosome segregation ATPase
VEAASQISESLRGLEVAAASLNRSTRQSEQVLTNMTTFVDQINRLRGTIEAAQQQIVDVMEPVERAARDIRASNDRTAGALTHTSELVGRVEVSVNALGEHQQRVANAWTEYQQRFEGIDDSLAKVFQQIDEGLSGYCDKVKEFANELDKTTSNVVQQLAGATAELNQSVDDLTDHLRRSR